MPRRQGCIVDPTVMISQRPAEAEDRAIPGHWEGDLIMGEGNRSAIGTLVERSTRYVMLLHLPAEHTAEAVRDALTSTVLTLPAHLRRSLTWDQGKEMAQHQQFTITTSVPVYFCDPHSPLAARIQREHQWAAPPVLPQEHRPDRAYPRGPACGGRRAECASTEDPELGHPSRAPQHAALTPQ